VFAAVLAEKIEKPSTTLSSTLQ